MIYALSLGTNIDHAAALQQVHAELELLGCCQYSPIYELPDRAGRAHLTYWNQAVLLRTEHLAHERLLEIFNQIEQRCGRVRPSQYVRMDIDLIGAGEQVSSLAVVTERLPLPADVYVPMLTLWPACPQPAAHLNNAAVGAEPRTEPLTIAHSILHPHDTLRETFDIK